MIEVSSFRGTQQSRCLPPHLRTETDPVSETLCCIFFRTPNDGHSPKAPVILNAKISFEVTRYSNIQR
jgi:hypothetical protein